MRALSIVAFVAAAFGTFIALVTYAVLCNGESGGSTSCPNGHATETMNAQLMIGLLGLLPPAVMGYFAHRHRRGPALIALILGVVLWVAWGVLNDAAVHGWGSEMRFVP